MNNTLKIIHLEDSPSDALLIGHILKRGGLDFERLVVDTREKFISALDQFNPDVVLADHFLPSFDSIEALEVFKTFGLRIPFILITGNTSEEFAVKILKKGADDYLLKDSAENLPEAIRSANEKFRKEEKSRQDFINQLISNEHKFRSLIENGGDAVITMNKDHQLIYTSSSISRVLGYSEKNALQLSLVDILHPEDKSDVLTTIASSLSKPGMPINGKAARIKHQDGSWRWVESTFTNMLDDQAIGGIVNNFRDVTERIEAEQVIKQSELQYRNLIQDLPIAVYTTDKKGNINIYNKAASELWGREPGPGNLWTGAWETYDHSGEPVCPEKCPMATALSEKRNVYEEEVVLERQDGTRRDVIPIAKPQFDAAGNLIGGVSILIDNTERKRNEEALKQKDEKLSAAQKIARLGYWEKKLLEGSFYWSDETYNIWGRSRRSNEHIDDIYDTIHPDDVENMKAREKRALAGTQEYDMEYRIVLPGGKIKWVHVMGKVVRDEQKRPVAIEGTVQDISERKEFAIRLLELNRDLQHNTEELVQANQGLEQFSYIISHNLRSPVANITGLADLLGQDEYPQEVKDQFLNELLGNVRRLDDVIVDLNTILQRKKKISEIKEPIDLAELVHSIQSSIQNLIDKEKVQIITDFRSMPQITTVASYLHSIFFNLIGNSIKYRQPGQPPVIGIRSEEKDGKILLTFEDNGIGIDLAKKKDEVFGLYKRFHNHVEGKGVGLFMVKTQIESLGGKISIASEINKGTKFTIAF